MKKNIFVILLQVCALQVHENSLVLGDLTNLVINIGPAQAIGSPAIVSTTVTSAFSNTNARIKFNTVLFKTVEITSSDIQVTGSSSEYDARVFVQYVVVTENTQVQVLVNFSKLEPGDDDLVIRIEDTAEGVSKETTLNVSACSPIPNTIPVLQSSCTYNHYNCPTTFNCDNNPDSFVASCNSNVTWTDIQTCTPVTCPYKPCTNCDPSEDRTVNYSEDLQVTCRATSEKKSDACTSPDTFNPYPTCCNMRAGVIAVIPLTICYGIAVIVWIIFLTCCRDEEKETGEEEEEEDKKIMIIPFSLCVIIVFAVEIAGLVLCGVDGTCHLGLKGIFGVVLSVIGIIALVIICISLKCSEIFYEEEGKSCFCCCCCCICGNKDSPGHDHRVKPTNTPPETGRNDLYENGTFNRRAVNSGNP